MTRCKEFYEKVRRDGNFCGMRADHIDEVKAYMEFLDTYPHLWGISERAARPVIREKDLLVKAKVIETIGKQIKRDRVPTVEQVGVIVQNTRDGKSNRGGDHKGAGKIEVRPVRNFSDVVEPEEKTPVETDPTETISDEVYQGIGDEAGDTGDTGDIPDMPDDIDETHDAIREPVIKTPKIKAVDEEEEEEEKSHIDREITEKAVKEYLKNTRPPISVDQHEYTETDAEEEIVRILRKVIKDGLPSHRLKLVVERAVFEVLIPDGGSEGKLGSLATVDRGGLKGGI